MKELQKLILVLGCAVFFIVFYILCAGSAQDARNYYSEYKSSSNISDVSGISVEDAVHKYVSQNLERDIKITATGDIMFYDYQMKRAYNTKTSSFDFSPSFSYISSYLSESNFVLGNLEGTMAGKYKGAASNEWGYYADTSTMNFNIPEDAAKDLKEAGFDMLTTANNHVLDSGIDAVGSTIDYITQAGLIQTGSFKTEDDARYVIKHVDGVNIGVIAYSNIMNGTLDSTNNYCVNYLDNYNSSKITLMCKQINEMRSKGAQIVVVSMHFGDKYSTYPNEYQQSLVKQLVGAGADIIFGSYPHVVQPMEIIETTLADGSAHTGLVFYSLGNFISSMQYQAENGNNRDLGAIASVTLTKTKDGIKFKEVEIVPTYVDWNDSSISVLPLCEVHDNPEKYESRFANDAAAFIDTDRIKTGYSNVINSIIGTTGLTYEYEDYKYKIKL